MDDLLLRVWAGSLVGCIIGYTVRGLAFNAAMTANNISGFLRTEAERLKLLMDRDPIPALFIVGVSILANGLFIVFCGASILYLFRFAGWVLGIGG